MKCKILFYKSPVKAFREFPRNDPRFVHDLWKPLSGVLGESDVQPGFRAHPCSWLIEVLDLRKTALATIKRPNPKP